MKDRIRIDRKGCFQLNIDLTLRNCLFLFLKLTWKRLEVVYLSVTFVCSILVVFHARGKSGRGIGVGQRNDINQP